MSAGNLSPQAKAARAMAFCGMGTALSVVLMMVLSAFGIGTYAVPMAVGVLTVPAKREFGGRYAWMMFAASALLALVLVPDRELAFMYAGLFGWYPLVKPRLDCMKKGIRIPVKFAIFNLALAAIYGLLVLLIGPAILEETGWMLVLLLVLGNVTFVLYDKALVNLTKLYERKRKGLRRR